MDERCEHGVPLGTNNPNLPCSRCKPAAPEPTGAPPKLERVPAMTAGSR